MKARLAVVVHGPEDAGFALRSRQTACFVDLCVFESADDLEAQLLGCSRLLRGGAAGQQQ
jgi:hypothetical protein